MRRFFVEPENITGSIATLSGNEARHISAVLRLAPGTKITLFDGSGSFYEAEITKISANRVEARIVSITPFIDIAESSRPAVHIGLGVLKGKKMDLVVQKITELGIASLQPFRSRFCAANEPDANRLSRWQKIALEACKQCNRPKPPELLEVMDFNNLLSASGADNHDMKLILWEEEGQKTLAQTLEPSGSIRSCLVLIGPEGGFNADEIKASVAAGFTPVSLGNRILRAETATIAAAAILQYHLGNLA